MKETLILIDANSLIHRSFHAIPPLTSNNGEPAGALYGLSGMLIKIFNEFKPTYIAAAFDRPEKTFRHKEYKEYKGTRAPVAKELIDQLEESKNLLNSFGISSFDKNGFEADDIVLTLAVKFSKKENLKIIILSGDLDVLQAVDEDRVIVEAPIKGITNTKTYNRDAVIERFGVTPDKLADYKGLVGDSSDNIPGVPGIGPKTAKELLKEYKSLEDLYKDIEEVGMTNAKLREKLIEFKKQALLSKKLATLKTDIDIDINLEDIKVTFFDNKEEAKNYLNKIGFDSLVSRIENNV